VKKLTMYDTVEERVLSFVLLSCREGVME